MGMGVDSEIAGWENMGMGMGFKFQMWMGMWWELEWSHWNGTDLVQNNLFRHMSAPRSASPILLINVADILRANWHRPPCQRVRHVFAPEAEAEFDTNRQTDRQTDRRSSIVRDSMSSVHRICCLVFIISFVVFFTNAAPLGKCNRAFYVTKYCSSLSYYFMAAIYYLIS